MKVSLSWLREYIAVDMPTSDLSEALTMAGLEVETVFDRYGYLDNVLCGKVLEVSPHPDADRLVVCRVDTGTDPLTIVCGAPNVREGLVTAVVLPGVELPGGVRIAKARIRGVTSEGMLCSAFELGIGDDRSGIVELAPETQPGMPLSRALGLSDPVFDIDLTPNRADCLGIIGVAREVAAICGGAVQKPDASVPQTGEDVSSYASVSIEEPELCPRYVARVVLDVKVGPSPFWLRDRLLSVGLKPINNIVDITNFVMMETGQPLHAFDLDLLSGNAIVVRCAGDDSTFRTLDGKERKLSPEMLMICDAQKPVAVAGVMGGYNSEINEKTTRVLIESACFKPASIRMTAKKLGLGTDASHRFERGVDPLGTVYAADRAAGLMAEIAGGKPAKGVIDINPVPFTEKRVSVSVRAVNERLGIMLDGGQIAGLLSSIGIGSRKAGKEDLLEVTVPSFRVDIERPEDIAEEVARLWGYNRIPVSFPTIPAEGATLPGRFVWRNRIKDIMAGFGFAEVVNYSFISPEACDGTGPVEGPDEPPPVQILNPLTREQSVMRTSLVPGLLKNTRDNIFQQERDIRIFEIGKVFLPRPGSELPDEPEMVAGLMTGLRRPHSWLCHDEKTDFYDIKGVLEGMLDAIGLGDADFTAMPPGRCRYMKPGHTALVSLNGLDIGAVGELSSAWLDGFGIRQEVFAFELNFSAFLPLLTDSRQAVPISKFPSVSRDITMIVDRSIEAGAVMKALAMQGQSLIEKVQLLYVYEGDPVPAGKRSLSLRVVYRSFDQTLKDEFVNRIHAETTEKLVAEFNAELPG